MGGGGFMQHARDTNDQDRLQKAVRREKFKGHNGEQILQKGNHKGEIDFSHLTQEQIASTRAKIKRIVELRNKKTKIVTVVVFVVFFVSLFLILKRLF